MFFAKPKSRMEVINDLNREAVNFYQVVQQQFDELRILVASTLHHRGTYADAKVIYSYPHLFSEVRRAWAFWVQTQMGFSSQVGSWGLDRQANTVARKITGKKEAFTDAITQRLEGVQIECREATRVIQHYDAPDAFHYVDPPYFNSDCGHYSGYTEANFRELLEVLSRVQGKFLLSCYPSAALSEYTERCGWLATGYEKGVAVTKHTKKRKVEMLTRNY